MIDLDPENANLYFQLGKIYIQLGDLKNASKYLKIAESQGKEIPEKLKKLIELPQ